MGNKKSIAFILVLIFISSTIIPAITAIKETQPQHIDTKIRKNQYDLLVITIDDFEQQIKPLKKHKENYGTKTKIVTLSKIYDEIYWQGRDKPEKIKYFIKKSYDNWDIKYVMLIGDNNKVPVRYVYNDEPWQEYPEPCYISELYYADIIDVNGSFSSWDSNDNGIYGEWKGNKAQDKNIDLRPDVYVGRLACRNKKEVKIMVDKITNYETKTYNQKWFKRFVVVAGDTYPEGEYPFNTSGYEGEENTKKAIENMTGFTPIKLWISNGRLNGPLDVIKAINKGADFMFFDGHASPTVWGTHKYNSHDFTTCLHIFHMPFLLNRYRLPVVVAGACHTAQFNVTPLNLFENFNKALSHGTWSVECWGWKLASKKNGGSIATIANTGLGMTKEDKDSRKGAGDYMDLQFFYEYGQNNTDILGEVWGKSIRRYLQAFPINWSTPSAWDYAYDAKTVQQWTLLGDPSLKIGGYPNV
ncbi:MAG: C25 family cysteine peptidase [Candidatus Thermoplasmatota archaeon]